MPLRLLVTPSVIVSLLLASPPAHAEPAAAEAVSAEGEDPVTKDQSIDAYDDLEDAQPGTPGHVEERLWLTWGYVPAEGYTPSDTLELSYTGKGVLKNTEFDLAQYFEHDDVDNSTGILAGWMQRWVKDGGRHSLRPSIGTLAEYYLRTPYVITKPGYAPGASVGDHVELTLTVAKYFGPGSLYLNGSVQHQLFNSEICVTEDDVAIQPTDPAFPDKDGPGGVNWDGCDYWAPWTLTARLGYNLPLIPDKLNVIADFIVETNEFTTQQVSDTNPEPEAHYPYDMGEVALMWHINEHWTLSPGVLFGTNSTPPIGQNLAGLGHEETPQYEAGIFLLHE